MRYFVIKELNNNLYLSRGYATAKICNAIFYENKVKAIRDSKSSKLLWDFIDALGYNVELLEPSQYKKLKEQLNIKVIPIEITEGCYIE